MPAKRAQKKFILLLLTFFIYKKMIACTTFSKSPEHVQQSAIVIGKAEKVRLLTLSEMRSLTFGKLKI